MLDGAPRTGTREAHASAPLPANRLAAAFQCLRAPRVSTVPAPADVPSRAPRSPDHAAYFPASRWRRFAGQVVDPRVPDRAPGTRAAQREGLERKLARDTATRMRFRVKRPLIRAVSRRARVRVTRDEVLHGKHVKIRNTVGEQRR